jgi:protein farnesyltransferase/geranylgeranyltransferase type-1 subunit alpha
MASFSGRPGWEDVTPVAQDDGPNPVVSIAYSAACLSSSSFTEFSSMFPVRELMDLFRAVLVSGEKSQRVLELIEELLETNPANYTIWSVPILGDRSCPPPVPSGNTEDRSFPICRST